MKIKIFFFLSVAVFTKNVTMCKMVQQHSVERECVYRDERREKKIKKFYLKKKRKQKCKIQLVYKLSLTFLLVSYFINEIREILVHRK